MPAPGQLYPLSTQRMTSTIPKSTTGQDREKEEQWLYPSPQMFYNAMRRKGTVVVVVVALGIFFFSPSLNEVQRVSA